MTKKKRNKEYRRVYKSLGLGGNFFICGMFIGVYIDDAPYVFTEFGLFNPRLDKDDWFKPTWFDNIEERLTCLAFCIAMTE